MHQTSVATSPTPSASSPKQNLSHLTYFQKLQLSLLNMTESSWMMHAKWKCTCGSISLSLWNGISFFYDDFLNNPEDIQLYTNISSSVGFGGHYGGKWFTSSSEMKALDSASQSLSSALHELYPIISYSVGAQMVKEIHTQTHQ